MNLYSFEILWVLVLEIKGFPTKHSVFRRGSVKKALPPSARHAGAWERALGEGGAEERQRKGEVVKHYHGREQESKGFYRRGWEERERGESEVRVAP